MGRRQFACWAVLILLSLSSCVTLFAQSVCDLGNGALNSAQPSGMAPAEIIQRFAAKESAFKTAQQRYAYTLDVSIQTLDNYGRIDGTYQQVSEVTLGADGARVERTTFAPESTLRRLTLTQDDLDDARGRQAFALTTEELPLFSITYAGRQHVDKLDTYVFEVSPKDVKKEKKLLEGRVWVDDQDLIIVKTCGKPRQDENAGSTKKNVRVNLAPVFVTYREEIDGQYWFPTYSRADEYLRFPRSSVHVREVVKYSNYKPLASK